MSGDNGGNLYSPGIGLGLVPVEIHIDDISAGLDRESGWKPVQVRLPYEFSSIENVIAGNMSTNESIVLLQPALCGICITLQPMNAVKEFITDSGLAGLLPDYQPRLLGVYGLYGSRRHQSRALRIFIDGLVDDFSGLESDRTKSSVHERLNRFGLRSR